MDVITLTLLPLCFSHSGYHFTQPHTSIEVQTHIRTLKTQIQTTMSHFKTSNKTCIRNNTDRPAEATSVKIVFPLRRNLLLSVSRCSFRLRLRLHLLFLLFFTFTWHLFVFLLEMSKHGTSWTFASCHCHWSLVQAVCLSVL